MIASQVKTIAELFRTRVTLSGHHECYRIKRDGRWLPVTWQETADEVETALLGLQQLGLKRGEAVAIMAETCPNWCVADLATILCGASSVGIYPTLTDAHVQYIMEDSSARFLFSEGGECFQRALPLLESVDALEHIIVWDQELAEPIPGVTTLEALMERGRASLADGSAPAPDPEVKPEDIALVVYTSGTTGEPKGVPLSHHNILSQLRAGEPVVPEPITPADITMAFLPMSHVAEHVPGFFGRINLGLRAAYASSIDTVIDELQEIRPTYFGAVPRIFEKMYGRIRERVASANPRRQALFGWAEGLARRYARAATGGPPLSLKDRIMYPLADLLVFRRIRAVFGGRVKTFITGSAPINLEILEFFYGVGMTILEVYGLSETTAIAFANVPGNVRLGTVGKAIQGVECSIAADGEILLRGDVIFGGYLNRADATKEAFDGQGFFCTGDIGKLDEHGYLRITDRKKNLIKTAGGKYVAPARLEALIKQEPLVSQVYVHGDERPYVVALITLDERETGRVAEDLGVSEDDLPNHPEVKRRIEVAIQGANDKLARFEQVKAHAILPADFSIEARTLTPTLKIKRREVADRYGSELDALYAPRA